MLKQIKYFELVAEKLAQLVPFQKDRNLSRIVNILSFLMQKFVSSANLQVILKSMVPLYQASMGETDQRLLHLFYQLEHVMGVNVTAWLYSWGDFDEDKEKCRSLMLNRKTVIAFTREGLVELILRRLRKDMSWSLIRSFPISRGFVYTPASTESQAIQSREHTTYDPAFIIPLLASLFTIQAIPDEDQEVEEEENEESRESDLYLVDARLFIEQQGLGMAISALSSQDEKMRNLAMFILQRFSLTLLKARGYREKTQILTLLAWLRDSFRAGERVPSIITHFASKSVMVLGRPSHPLYPTLNQFLLKKQVADLKDIPMFYELMHGARIKNFSPMLWLLDVLITGAPVPSVAL